MSKIDLSAIIEDYSLDKEELARRLFPAHAHPRHAIRDVIKGVLDLRVAQLSVLSDMAGVSVPELFKVSGWGSLVSNDRFTFTRKNYRVTIDKQTWETKIMHDGSMFSQEVLVNKAIPLSEFLAYVDETIKKHKESQKVDNK